MGDEVGKMIYSRMHNVMENVEYLAKDDTISYNKVSYKGLSEEKVTRVIRAELVKNRIIVFPIKQEHHREGTLTTVDVTYRFVCIDDGSFIEAVSSGTGSDTQDKGVGKAMTYSYKYLWLRTFAIPTGEDPDKVSSAELDDREAKSRCANGKKQTLQMLEDYEKMLDETYVFSVRQDVDKAFADTDVDGMVSIYDGLRKEVRKLDLADTKERAQDFWEGQNLKKASELEAEDQKDLDIF